MDRSYLWWANRKIQGVSTAEDVNPLLMVADIEGGVGQRLAGAT